MIYRYLGLREEKHFKWLSDLLVSGRLYFSPASDFNDPNEFRFQLRVPDDKNVIQETWRRDNPHQPESEFETWYSSTSFKSWHIYLEPLIQDDFITRFGVVCFSRKPNNPTMWAHYANNHRGICLGFEDFSDANYPDVLMSGEVKYQKDLPVVRYFGEEPKKMIYNIFFNKFEDWKYEQEFRLVADAGVTLAFNPAVIKEVILGKDIESAVAERVRQLVAERSAATQLHKARLSYLGYEMEIH